MHKHVGDIYASNGDSFNQLVTFACKCLLPRSAGVLLLDFTSDTTVPPDLTHFTKFLDRGIEATETLSDTNQSFFFFKTIQLVILSQ